MNLLNKIIVQISKPEKCQNTNSLKLSMIFKRRSHFRSFNCRLREDNLNRKEAIVKKKIKSK